MFIFILSVVFLIGGIALGCPFFITIGIIMIIINIFGYGMNKERKHKPTYFN